MRTENLAIAFVDIAGFTERTSGQSREDNERMLRHFDDVVRPPVRGFGGRVIKTIGDAYLLSFRSPTDALHCAMAVHDRLALANAELPEDKRLSVRVAVNAGDVRVEGGDVFGEAVNIAARIESKTPAGEIYFSEAVYLAMTRAEVPSAEVGPTKLKGIAEPVRIFRVPRANEAEGYRLDVASKGAEDGSDAAAGELPFAGFGLSRLRMEPSPLARPSQKLGDLFNAVLPWTERGGRWLAGSWRQFLARWQGSRRFRAVTAGVLLVVVAAAVVALVWPKPKPLTPWQKVKREFGLRSE